MATAENKTPLVLIVEDTPDIADMTQIILKGMGLNTVHVSDGLAALDFLETQTPDVMLLDINLPMLTGWETLEAMRGRFGTVPFPVVVMTALSDPANKLIGKLQKPVVQYITKPFMPDDLRQAITNALKK